MRFGVKAQPGLFWPLARTSISRGSTHHNSAVHYLPAHRQAGWSFRQGHPSADEMVVQTFVQASFMVQIVAYGQLFEELTEVRHDPELTGFFPTDPGHCLCVAAPGGKVCIVSKE